MTLTWHERMSGWHKSSYTHWEENACVEVGTEGAFVGIRDTKQHALPPEVRPVLVVSAAGFTALLTHLSG
ncbi:DUF397 domain-containing protein [Amycolatopsis regifaucium]|uniref:DUF397 domain-containing protein n=1 Tax=Amycolatopsis regifaucium TaxID=546365 RepID=A0A154MDG6_9PSEU|nr:DUF397 domain-containing protein [Amycolatopsis regifaucium]KZB82618.1 DUF397 domain-containing protein [Amycolatopsis regifaucium]OKA10323.1 DUF397 domain-containing protein [Amycolatopsis regifaucium]SFG90373.1 protein of unknown function [Amycolatopsis regifaucium]